jgi:biotin carboxylase/GNAT superfamily N-acetyltransferase
MAPRATYGPLRLIDKHVRFRDPGGAVEAARTLHATHPFHAVVGYDDQVVPLVAQIAADFGLPGNSVEAALAARDKVLMKERFGAGAVPMAPYHLALGEEDAIGWAAANGYPVVVKPVRGSASQGVIRADNELELRTAYRRVRRIVRECGLDTGGRSDEEQLVEGYLEGSEYSVELMMQRGRIQVLCRFEKPHPLTGPFFEETIYVTPPRLKPSEIEKLDGVAVHAAESLGLSHGFAHCEIRWTNLGPFVLEVGARLIGGACSRVFRQIFGEDIHLSVLQVALGREVGVPVPAERAVGAMMLPIPKEGRLDAVKGLEAARRISGITEAIVAVGPGDSILPFPEQSCYIGFLSAKGASVDDVCGALEHASNTIEFVLRPLECEFWTRELNDCSSFVPSQDSEIRLLESFSREEAREIVIPLIAASNFGERPHKEAIQEAEHCVDWLESGPLGKTSPSLWMVADNSAVALGSVDGNTCYISCLGVMPRYRGSGTGRAMVRSMMTLFAQQGCSRMRVLLDPRQPARNLLYADLGFRREECERQTSSA